MRIALVSVVLALVPAAVSAAGSTPPHVALVQAAPVVVAGGGFTPGHAVSVGYVSGAQHARREVRANAQGAVRAVFDGFAFVRCRGASVRAAGAAALVILPCSAPGGEPTVEGTIAGVVRGSAFVPGEHVVLMGRVSDADPVTTKLDAESDGSFATRLAVPRRECGELFLRAVGSLGSIATFTLARPDCKSP
jgi:hypothetical protein